MTLNESKPIEQSNSPMLTIGAGRGGVLPGTPIDSRTLGLYDPWNPRGLTMTSNESMPIEQSNSPMLTIGTGRGGALPGTPNTVPINRRALGLYDLSNPKDRPHNQQRTSTPNWNTKHRNEHKNLSFEQTAPLIKEVKDEFYYLDPNGIERGPFAKEQMYTWYHMNYFADSLQVRRSTERYFKPLLALKNENGTSTVFEYNQEKEQMPSTASPLYRILETLMANGGVDGSSLQSHKLHRGIDREGLSNAPSSGVDGPSLQAPVKPTWEDAGVQPKTLKVNNSCDGSSLQAANKVEQQSPPVTTKKVPKQEATKTSLKTQAADTFIANGDADESCLQASGKPAWEGAGVQPKAVKGNSSCDTSLQTAKKVVPPPVATNKAPKQETTKISSKTQVADNFKAWVNKKLEDINSTIDASVMADFLGSLENPNEVENYIHEYLVTTRIAKDFTKEYLQKRSESHKLSHGIDKDDLSSASSSDDGPFIQVANKTAPPVATKKAPKQVTVKTSPKTQVTDTFMTNSGVNGTSQAANKVIPQAATKPAWGGAGVQPKIVNVSSTWDGPSLPATSKIVPQAPGKPAWGGAGVQPKTVKVNSSWDGPSLQAANKVVPPSVATKKASKQEAAKTSPKAQVTDTFKSWVHKKLKEINSTVDASVMADFLGSLENPNEVEDYVQEYLGTTRIAKDFTKEYLQKRSESRRLSRGVDKDDLSSASQAATGASLNQTKKKKNKGTRVAIDRAFLGFRATADPNRVNKGEIDLPVFGKK